MTNHQNILKLSRHPSTMRLYWVVPDPSQPQEHLPWVSLRLDADSWGDSSWWGCPNHPSAGATLAEGPTSQCVSPRGSWTPHTLIIPAHLCSQSCTENKSGKTCNWRTETPGVCSGQGKEKCVCYCSSPAEMARRRGCPAPKIVLLWFFAQLRGASRNMAVLLGHAGSAGWSL